MIIPDKAIKAVLCDRPVLVTGAAGFVGSWLTERLEGYDAQVHVFVRATSSSTLHNLRHLRSRITLHRGDLADKQAVMVALRKLKAVGGNPIIFHLGGQAHVGESWDRPYETLYTNVLGTVNLLQSIVDLDLPVYRVDVAGSSEEYGNVREDMKSNYRFDANGGLILDECSPINPHSVYATSKVAEDFLARNYFKAYGIPCVVTRMFNNYGPRQSPRFITGTIISQALERDEIKLGYAGAKRDFCYVEDGAMGHINVALYGTPGDVYVYGYGKSITISDWCRLIIRIGLEKGYWKEKTCSFGSPERSRLGHSEVEELRVSYDKLNKLTGWKPQFDWEHGIAETIKWYAENRDRWVGRVDWK